MCNNPSSYCCCCYFSSWCFSFGVIFLLVIGVCSSCYCYSFCYWCSYRYYSCFKFFFFMVKLQSSLHVGLYNKIYRVYFKLRWVKTILLLYEYLSLFQIECIIMLVQTRSIRNAVKFISLLIFWLFSSTYWVISSWWCV